MLDNRISALERLRNKTALGWGRVREFLLHNTAAGTPSGAQAPSAGRSKRRELLGKLGALPVLSLVAGRCANAQSQEKAAVAAPTSGTSLDEGPFSAERLKFYQIKVIDLNAPETVAKQKSMPVGKIGNVPVGRLICGSNLIGINMHARDLGYVRQLATHYATKDRIWMTMKKCEELGVDTFNLKANNFRQFDLLKYKEEYGGRVQWMADVIAGTDLARFEPVLLEHLKFGASMVYLWGGSTDQWFYQKQERNIVKAYEIMRKYKVPVGICAHRIEPIMFCEKEGLKPDYYVLTFHHDRYWSAHPKENRRFIEMFDRKMSIDHGQYHDNMFCVDAEGVAAFMQNVKVPWVAFKVMAAGAITPEDGFKYAFQNGADFICVGMFDFQVEQDVEIAIKAIAEAGNRKRPWYG